jgi:hypothetical protein
MSFTPIAAASTYRKIKQENEPNHSLNYCSEWIAPQEVGHPDKGTRKKLAIELAQGKNQKLKKLKVRRMYCQTCKKYNHTVEMCYKIPKNA